MTNAPENTSEKESLLLMQSKHSPIPKQPKSGSLNAAGLAVLPAPIAVQ